MHLNVCSHLFSSVFFCIFFSVFFMVSDELCSQLQIKKYMFFFLLLERKDLEIYSMILYIFLNCYICKLQNVANVMIWFICRKTKIPLMFFFLVCWVRQISSINLKRSGPLHCCALLHFIVLCVCAFWFSCLICNSYLYTFIMEKKVMWKL